MNYTIKEFIESNKFPKMQLISDHSGIHRVIRGVQILAAPNMEKFLGGGELLLTSLVVYENQLNERIVLSHLEELNKKQVSVFVVKRRQNTPHLNKLFEILVHFCDEHSIPVLELPQNISYWSIIRYLLPQIFNMEIAKAVYSKMTRDELNFLFFEKSDNAGALEEVLDRAEKILENPIALYDEDYHSIYPSESEKSELIIAEDNEKFVPNILTQYEYIRQKRENIEYIKKINILDQCMFYLVISEVNEPLIELDFITLENVILNLRYVLTQIVTAKNIERKYHRDLEYRMLNGLLSDSEEDEVANLLKLNAMDNYQVITFYLKPEMCADNFSADQRKETEIVEKTILNVVPKEYIYCNANRVIYIHKENKKEEKLDFRVKLENFQKEMQDQLIERKARFELLIGIGKSVKGYHNLKDSFEDSKIAIEYIDVIRKLVGDAHKSVVDCSKLGFFHIFTDIKDEKQLRMYIPDAVNAIRQYDLQKNGELINTLECYLNQKQSIRKTSELMNIHARTVSYRLQKIVRLTGMNFDNIAEMLAVRNGIIILKILEQL